MKRSLAVAAVAMLVQAPAAAGWTWPVDGPVLRPFTLGKDPYAAGQHRGIDIGAEPGTAVRAAVGGTVTFAGAVPAGGRAVTVRSAGGLSVTHVELGAVSVERGVEVAEGEPVGTIGVAAHVHLGVRVAADPQGYLDPLQFLPDRSAAPERAEAREVPVDVPQPRAAQPEPVEQPEAVESKPPPQARPRPQVQPEPQPETPAAARVADSPGEAETDRRPVEEVAGPTPATAATPESVPAPAQPLTVAEDATQRAPGSSAVTVPAPAAAGRLADGGAARPVVPSQRNRTLPAQRRGLRSTVRSRPSTESTVHGATHVDQAQARTPAENASGGAAVRSERATPSRRTVTTVRGSSDTREDPANPWVVPLVGGLLAASAAALAAPRLSRRRRVVPDRPYRRVRCARVRPARIVHGCVRAHEPGWIGAASPRGSPSRRGPLPRPRRRAQPGVVT